MAPPSKPRPRWSSQTTIIVLILLFIVALWIFGREPQTQTLRYGQFRQILNAPGVSVRNVRVGRTEIRGEIVTRDRLLGDEKSEIERAIFFRTPRIGLERDEGLQALLDSRVGSDYQAEEEDGIWKTALSWLATIFILAFTLILSIYIFSRVFGGGGGAFGFGRSRHKLYTRHDLKITFNDVAGIDEAKAELTEVVDFLKTPEKYQALGGRIPKGVLLVGPPGTGKTLLAKAVAGEANVPFFSISGSDFVELFAGLGASRVRDLFREAQQQAPVIIFIDELDALGRSRAGHALTSHEEREQTLNQLLVEMDGFDTNRGVIIMAATNRPEILDPALLRPGRFDRTVVVDRPDIEGREAILRVHARGIKIADDVNLRKVAALTPGSVGADLANLVNEAALLAARKGRSAVSMADFDEAIERTAVGLERKSRIMSIEEKRRLAFHEAGHALVACAVPNSDPVHKVSIIPRGLAGGYVLQRPENDRLVITQSQLESHIKVALAGTISEELVFGEISTGATSDLQKANEIARRMVTEFGMSQLGRIYLGDPGQMAFLSNGLLGEGGVSYSDSTAEEIDREVRQILERCLADVRNILRDARPALDSLADVLIEKEVIDGSELSILLGQHGIHVQTPPK